MISVPCTTKISQACSITFDDIQKRRICINAGKHTFLATKMHWASTELFRDNLFAVNSQLVFLDPNTMI